MLNGSNIYLNVLYTGQQKYSKLDQFNGNCKHMTCQPYTLVFVFSVRLLSVLRGHSVF